MPEQPFVSPLLRILFEMRKLGRPQMLSGMGPCKGVSCLTRGDDIAGADTPTAKFFINCLAEPPEEVAQYLVPRIRKVPQEMRSIGGGIGQVAFFALAAS